MSKFSRKTKSVYAIVGDGECEKWYFQMLKENEKLIINIQPQLLKNTILKKQFENVKNLSEDYDIVYWIVDYDVIEKETLQCKPNEEKRCDEFARYYKNISEKYQNVKILVVNPCFEYWLVLHYKYTNKSFSSCDESVKELEKLFSGYEKKERFYKKSNSDIYKTLKPNLNKAKSNAKKLGDFNIENPSNPVCEIHKMFDDDGNFMVFKN